MQQMTSRFFFYGNAAAISGHIWRPRAYDIEVNGASSLTPAGGISRAQIPPYDDGFVRFKSAETLAEGRYTFPAAVAAGPVPPVLPATTTVLAEMVGLEIGKPARVKVDLMRAVLTSTNPDATLEPPIKLGPETVVSGISIDGEDLDVGIDHDFYQRFDTRAKLVAACQDRGFVKQYEPLLMLSAPPAAPPPVAAGVAAPVPIGIRTRPAHPTAPPALVCKDPMYGTVVALLKWKSVQNHPTARIAGHTIAVKDFGTIFFGEILIGTSTRRLTMLRFEFGSPDEGDMGCCAVGKNGSWVP
jgi:hypothetical protein